jgi:hypothetical protein
MPMATTVTKAGIKTSSELLGELGEVGISLRGG